MNKLLRSSPLCVGLMSLLAIGTLRAAPLPVDSVGIEKRDGKRLVIHRVDQGQTLYAIARRYHASVASIREANPSIKDAVQYGQTVRVPFDDANLSRRERKAIDRTIREAEKESPAESAKDTRSTETTKKVVKKAEPVISGNSGIHVVEPGQTLYSLSVRYGVPQASLRKWNNLGADNVLIGQALIVTERAYSARQPTSAIKAEAAKPAPKPARPKAEKADKPEKTEKPDKTDKPASAAAPEREPAGAPTAPAATSVAATEPPEEPRIIRPGDTAPLPATGRRVSDLGLAEAIEGGDNSGKYLALHRSAPIGTLVQVRNDVNNQSIWVKVVGRLPNTGINDRVLVKLTARAFAKLSPADRRFRAEVSYIIP